MRGIGLAALILLHGCGSQPADNAVEAPATAGGQAPEETAATDPTPEQAGNIAANEVQAASVSPCLMQGQDRLDVKPLRAVGTEPFWGARIEGRCVTYSHPDDQQGTRVWTRYSPGQGGSGTWIGQLGGKPFELRTRSEPGCSDGMSDERYPMAVDLLVGGEYRVGCAEPA